MARLLFTSRHFGSLANPEKSESAKQLSKLIGNPIYFMKQTHGNKISVVDSQSSPNGAVYDGDGVVTNKPNVALAVQVADCLPLLLVSKSVVAAVHVGRKGLLNKVALATLDQMKKLGADQISGAVGPHICGDCYEVDPGMYGEIVKEHPATGGKNNHLNLFAGLKDQLKGIEISNLGICTKENSDYFSHRADATLGRQVGVVSL
jgi:YfiH family protein